MGHSKAAKVQRTSAAHGPSGCKRRVGLGDLPVELLVIIFSFVQGPGLRPVRLVCRSFRQASIDCITGLRLATENEGCPLSAMSAFVNIASLTLFRGVIPAHEAWPQIVSKLGSLVVHYSPLYRAALESLPLHSGLTSLALQESAYWWTNHYRVNLHDALVACPALQSLEVSFYLVLSDPGHTFWRNPGISRLSALQELRVFWNKGVWEFLLPRLTCLAGLRSLSLVHVRTAADISALVALTQLTALGAVMCPRNWISCLQALTLLKRVAVVHPFSWTNWEIHAPGAYDYGPFLQQLPTSWEVLCLWDSPHGGSQEGLGALSGMTELQRLVIGVSKYTRDFRRDFRNERCGRWSLEGPNAWCERLTGLRELALIGRPIGAPDLDLLAQHLSKLQHLWLRLETFNGVHHLSALTRLTLLHLYNVTRVGTYATRHVQGCEGAPLQSPTFLSAMPRLRDLNLHWEVWVGEERETVLCLASLPDLHHLHVRLVPWKRASAAPQLCGDASADAPPGSAREPCGRQDVDVKEQRRRRPCSKKLYMGITMLEPVIRHWSLQDLEIGGGYMVVKKTWERIGRLRESLGLPLLTRGSSRVFADVEFRNFRL